MDPIREWFEPWDVNRRLRELSDALTTDVLIEAVTRAQAAWAACTRHHPRSFAGIASWAEGIRTLRDQLTPFNWSSEDDRGQPRAVDPEGILAITVLSGDEITGKVGQGQPRTKTGHGPATIEFVDTNAYLWPQWESEARASLERERILEKNTWVLLMYRDTKLGQVRCELSHPTGMDGENRIISWSERIILPPVEFEPIPENVTMNEGPDDGEITIDIKRRA
jgi:hypothetical protein